MKIAVLGSTGKMGREFIAYFKDKYELVCIHSTGVQFLDVIDDIDMAVDFTRAKAAYEHGVIALTHHKPIIIGTTGLNEKQKHMLKMLARRNETGCMMASNFSIGMLWIKRNVNELSKYFEHAKIIEQHHISKLDSPSGTALSLKRILHIDPTNIIAIRRDNKEVKHRIILENENESVVIEHVVKKPSAYMVQLEECIEDIMKLRSFVEFE